MNEELISDPILAEIEKITSEEIETGLFKTQSANKWIEQAEKRPIPNMLFDEFWYESELCILFADTNLGKSILAVQIADSISKGNKIKGFKLEAPEQKVLYFDFELSDKQLQGRYSENYKNNYNFHDNLLRAELMPFSDKPEGFNSYEEYLTSSIENEIKKHKTKIIIIDNITYLRNDTERARDALPLMKELKGLKINHSLSILVIAHTPKRDLSKPLSRNDLSGSKMLINFCDSSLAIGESMKDKNLRYIKQIKVRNSEFKYDSENVVICELVKEKNFLGFTMLDFGSESEHLKQRSEEERSNLDISIIELKKSDSSLSNREIARRLNTNPMRVTRAIDKHKEV